MTTREPVPHRGPTGWTAHATDLVIDWIAPHDEAVIRVFPAVIWLGEPAPIEVLVATTHAMGLWIDGLAEPSELPTDPGVVATVWELATATARCDLVVLRDDRYEYAVVLESRDDLAQRRHRAALHALVASITPIAPSRLRTHEAVAAFAHWTL